MKIASIKFLASILFSAIAVAPLRAQINAPVENGTNRPVAVTDSAQASNPIAATGTNYEKKQSFAESPPVRINETGVHVGIPNPVDIIRGNKGTDVVSIVAILGVFSMNVAIVAIFFNFLHRRNKMLHETLRAMIEKGVPIPPELITKSEGTLQKPLNDLRSGLILVGMGIGLTMLVGKVGFILLFMGVALLIVWLVGRRNKNDDQPPKL